MCDTWTKLGWTHGQRWVVCVCRATPAYEETAEEQQPAPDVAAAAAAVRQAASETDDGQRGAGVGASHEAVRSSEGAVGREGEEREGKVGGRGGEIQGAVTEEERGGMKEEGGWAGRREGDVEEKVSEGEGERGEHDQQQQQQQQQQEQQQEQQWQPSGSQASQGFDESIGSRALHPSEPNSSNSKVGPAN